MTTKQKNVMDKLWPTQSYPLSYADALGALSKQELTNIRVNLKISNMSSLNKQGLVDKLQHLIPEHVGQIFHLWDRDRLKVIQKVLQGEGRLTNPMMEIQQYDYFRDRGLLFPATIDGQRMLIMPLELVEWFKSSNKLPQQDVIYRNTDWIQLSKGLVFYYGTLTSVQLQELALSYCDKNQTDDGFMEVLIDASSYYDEIRFKSDEVSSFTYLFVDNAEWVRKEQAIRPTIDFYPFTKQQLLKAAAPEFIDRNKHYLELVRYILTQYEADRDDVEFLIDECVDVVRNGGSLIETVQLIQESFEAPDLDMMSAIADLLVPLINGTKQWALKGYSSEELSAIRKNATVNVLAAAEPAKEADVISITTKQKIGRNDPCPCGSGSKFKKCCGKQ